MHAPIPAVEIPHHAHAQRVRRPHRELDPSYSGDLAHVRAHLFVALPVRPFAEKMQVEIRQHRRKGISVRHFADAAVVPLYPQAIVARLEVLACGRHQRLENSVGSVAKLQPFRRDRLSAAQDHAHGRRIWLYRAHQNAPPALALHHVRSQQAKSFAMLRPGQRLEFHFQPRRSCRRPSYRFRFHSRPCMLRQLRQMSPSLSPRGQHPESVQ